jgi:integrase
MWTLNQIMEGGAMGVQITVSGKLRGDRSAFEKHTQGILPRAGNYAKNLVSEDITHTKTPMGLIGIKIRIATKEKLIPEPIKFKELKEGVQLYHYFNESEINQIYHYINEHMDSSYLRYFHFYNQTGMRPTEPFIGELVGDWYLISGEDRKNGIPMQMQLNEELKSILLEMQSFRDSKLHCVDANERVCDIFSRTLNKIVTALGLTGKRLTLYSFRHSFAIRRITMTNGNIYDVMREMGHSNPQTTMGYLRFPEQRRLDDFPSLKEYISNPQNMQKNTIRATNLRATIYDNINKLSVSPR